MTEPPPAARHWDLDPEVVFLNHGSFGACPRPVLELQGELRARMERQPVLFLGRQLEGLLDESRERLGRFVGADPDDLAFVTNATSGVNTVLRSLDLRSGDELLVTDHEYNACRNAIDAVAARRGAAVRIARIPFPLRSADEVVERVLDGITDATRLVLVDHVTSPTGMILPVADIVRSAAERGVDTLVDGAHAPGMLPLDLEGLGAAYYTGNCHKWLCTPKGSAFLHVRRDRQAGVRPLTISHGANSPRTDRTRFRLEFDWTGTQDPTAWLCIPAAIDFLGGLFPGGFEELRSHNRSLVLEGRAALCEVLGIEPPCPEDRIGSLASVPLPPGPPPEPPSLLDPLHVRLGEQHGIEVPVIRWPSPPLRLLRISGQAYNRPDHYRRLADALRESLA